ncbi:hypothetical protein C0992_003897 [Termitomyces sp. T32_za158]|nr:hypothetical protein C0992_003897 [Termitomyces sp. T32_za158]
MTDEMQNVPLNYVKEKLGGGLQVSGLVATLLERQNNNKSSREEMDIKGVAATIFAGNSETKNLIW